ncbi:unnamed protein product [Lampetra planeri]
MDLLSPTRTGTSIHRAPCTHTHKVPAHLCCDHVTRRRPPQSPGVELGAGSGVEPATFQSWGLLQPVPFALALPLGLAAASDGAQISSVSKHSSLADLRMKARRHAASLGLSLIQSRNGSKYFATTVAIDTPRLCGPRLAMSDVGQGAGLVKRIIACDGSNR